MNILFSGTKLSYSMFSHSDIAGGNWTPRMFLQNENFILYHSNI